MKLCTEYSSAILSSSPEQYILYILIICIITYFCLLILGYYAVPTFIEETEIEKLRPMSQDLYYEFPVVMLRKSSVLMPSFNNLVLQVFESGIALYWEGQVVRNYLNISMQMAIKHSLDIENQIHLVKLKFHHISGALAIWCIGLSFATLCFIYENIYYRIGLYEYTP